MSYELEFEEEAKKEWDKLDNTVRIQFIKKLESILENPHISASALYSMPQCYKIKLRSIGYRLVYRVDDNKVVVTVITVGRRDSKIYEKAAQLLSNSKDS